ncbi:Hsp20/alpha crystallin family protein [Natronorubrum halophilum]|uniref:Hsp20/alpha crystallin family protein n=1 Tax=Natronorubrum halophilum TaxID=1702106 RepID=UPI0010C190A0|nr:Hsp20/alpha crystallin family protein [Natronorubrum halophilum]
MRSFDDMNRMFREMDHAFDQLRSTWMSEFGAPGVGPALESGSEESTMMVGGNTTATLEDEGDAYVYVMDLPGFEKADIDLTFADGMLEIRAHTDVEEGSDAVRSVRSRRIGRQVPIPKAIVTDEITASYHNGVLEVHLPIVEDEREDNRHRIDIE